MLSSENAASSLPAGSGYRPEKFFFWTAAACVLLLQLLLVMCAPALWRDEISSALLARAPSWGAMYSRLVTDSFPGLWVTLLRLWADFGPPGSDLWLRYFGVLIYGGVILVLAWMGRSIFTSPPLLSLALIAFNPAVFYWGVSLRAYGLGLLLVLLFFALAWRYVEQPGAGRAGLALLACLLCAHANYQDSYLIFAICAGAATVAALAGRRLAAAGILGIGFISGASLLIYLPTIHDYSGGKQIMEVPFRFRRIGMQFADAFGDHVAVLLTVFLALAFFTVILPLLLASRSRLSFIQSLYPAVVLVVATVSMICFIAMAGLPTEPWYYIPYIGLASVCMEFALRPFLQERLLRAGRAALAFGIITASFGTVWMEAHMERTNADRVAAAVSGAAVPKDYILVAPFWCGVSFEYYYKGQAPWCIFPVVPKEQRDMSYRVIKKLMLSDHPLDASYAKVEAILRGGGRIWCVGGLPRPASGRPIPQLTRAPDPRYGWNNVYFVTAWALQMCDFLQNHSTRMVEVDTVGGALIAPTERIPMLVVEGWKD